MIARYGRWILIGLTALLGASIWRMVVVDQERQRIAKSYEEATVLVQQLESERAHLNDELSEARQTVEGQAESLGGLEQELAGVQGELEKTLSDLAALQREHQELRRNNATLEGQLGSLTVEKQQLEAKLSSLKELRVAIKDVKRKIWRERWARWEAKAQAQREVDREKLATGNRGFVVRGGASTLSSGTRLQVHVLEPQPQ